MHEQSIKALKQHCEKLLQMNLRNAETLGSYSAADIARFDSIEQIKKTIAFLESAQGECR